MHTLVTSKDMFRDPFGFNAFFRQDPFGLLRTKIVESSKEDDGTLVFNHNLAGFKAENVRVQFNNITQDLTVKAEQEGRVYTARVTVPVYTKAEDITVSYQDGLLSVRVSAVSDRENEAVVDIPLS